MASQSLDPWPVYYSLVSPGLIALLSLPAVKSLAATVRGGVDDQNEQQKGLYRDPDGEATEKTQSECSSTTATTTMNGAAVLGLSLATYNFDDLLHGSLRMSLMLSWILLSVQALSVYLEPKTCYQRRYSLGIRCATSAALVLPLAVYRATRSSSGMATWLQAICAAAVLFASLSIPQRPVVFLEGLQIDHELSVSFLSRLFFSWSPFQKKATSMSEQIAYADIPEIGHLVRVQTLKQQFKDRAGQTTTLWKKLLLAFLPRMAQQWLLVFLNAFFEFGSKLALFKLLQCLERPEGIETTNTEMLNAAWFWVAVMGSGLIAEVVSSGWVIWVSQMRLHLPAEQLLKSLILDKTTTSQIVSDDTTDGKDGKPSRASLTDLVSNSCMETAGFYGGIHYFLKAIFKILLDAAYLSQLLGVKSVLVGALSALMLSPLSVKLSSRHAEMRGQLFKSHNIVSKLVSEALTGLRQIRLSSLEEVWERKLLTARSFELCKLWDAGIALASWTFVTDLSSILLASVALSIYSYDNRQLTASVAFVSLNLFGNLYAAFQELPARITNIKQSWVSCKKIEQYLSMPEQTVTATASDQMSLDQATFSWPADDGTSAFSLHDVDVQFPKGRLSIVTGETGAGKSLFLAAILDEVHRSSGSLMKLETTSADKQRADLSIAATAFVSQPPWIENSTVRENILFGRPYDKTRYQKTLYACALDKDLDVLPDGDQTSVGLNGAMLSGGQKWRVALARALYSSSETLVLEDVLSAVDAPVAKWICKYALTGELANGRTIILATHQPNVCLASASYLVDVQNGTAKGSKPENALEQTSTTEASKVTEPSQTATKANLQEEKASNRPAKLNKDVAPESAGKIMSAYIASSGGLWPVIIGILITLGHRAASNSSSWWLAHWTANQSLTASLSYNIAIYMALSVGSSLALAIKSVAIRQLSNVSSFNLFKRMVHGVFFAPMSWIDSMPLGEMVQVLEHDMYSMDNRTTGYLNDLLGNLLHILFIFFTSLRSAPQTAVLSVAVLIAYYHTAHAYFKVSRQLQKLIDASMRPVFEHVTSVSAGLATIRAFGRAQFYRERMEGLTNTSTKLGWNLALGQRWLAVRLGSMGALFVTATAAALVFQRTDAAQAGFIISLAFQLRVALSGALGGFSFKTVLQGSMGRIVSLAQVQTEPQDGLEPAISWPAAGAVEVQDLTLSYDPTLPPALKSVSFSLSQHQRLGIVGRTGAGKTSLTNALMRFIDPTGGSVIIDGQDTARVSLKRLRNAIRLIPQDPFLFSGTLRENIDPGSTVKDKMTLLKVLRRVRLITDKEDRFADLDMPIQSGGANLSHGQRQLICLARALLAQCRILILDEASSGVDTATDAVIQQVIRDEFSEATIIVIAHRLLTIADFDMVIVMDNGRVAEASSPAQLLETKKSVFYAMVQQSGDKEAIETTTKSSQK